MSPPHVSLVPLEFTDIGNLCVGLNSIVLWTIHHNFTASKRTQLMANLPYTPIVSPNFTFHYPTVSMCTNRGCMVTRATIFFMIAPNISSISIAVLFPYVQKSEYQFARTEHKALDNSGLHRPLQNYGPSVCNLQLVTLMLLRTFSWQLEF